MATDGKLNIFQAMCFWLGLAEHVVPLRVDALLGLARCAPISCQGTSSQAVYMQLVVFHCVFCQTPKGARRAWLRGEGDSWLGVSGMAAATVQGSTAAEHSRPAG
jgi:hypothetical protein